MNVTFSENADSNGPMKIWPPAKLSLTASRECYLLTLHLAVVGTQFEMDLSAALLYIHRSSPQMIRQFTQKSN
jgi:hypothetical protein